MKTNLESVREIYSIIENLGSTKDRKHIKIFYNHVKQWKVKNNYSSVLIPVKKKTVFTDLFLFTKCIEIAIVIELFVRGVGYFSPGIFLYLTLFFCSLLSNSLRSRTHANR